MAGMSPEARESRALEAVQGVDLSGIHRRIAGVFATAAALNASIREHQAAVTEAGKVEPPKGFLFRLVSLEDDVFVQVYDLGKSKSYQHLPTGTEFYAAGITANSRMDRFRLAIMTAYRPRHVNDRDYYMSPLIITSPAFTPSLFPEADYHPKMNSEGRHGPNAPKWQPFPRGNV